MLPQAPNLEENYEIKLILNPDLVLDPASHAPTPALLSAFSSSPTPTKMSIQFLDDSDKTIYGAGWSPRIRRTEGKPGFELTYKKRYPITAGNVNEALRAANTDGFDASDTKYEAQVEWGYKSMTLSVSRDKKVPGGEVSSLVLPDAEAAREMLREEAPGKFKNFGGEEGWGIRALERVRVYGPVLAGRFAGTWGEAGVKISLEIWPVMIKDEGRFEYIVEVSFKAANRAKASPLREQLIAMLEGKGWLCPRDSLKTQLIMDNY
ncbi:hypothetical protein B0T25DRAFT_610364 [Lasiosphaeria hispida]|uniref:CYTH domain-containing protein n=1 Tax=Lasiosphaeria hispida TaxID=260671 RepID=A0AAJ0HES9_9PEZI|nr:hypothetical protein B0T25DRAFT_610364 [Lasiosphaeria hispida]